MILSKAENFRLWTSGAFGNRLRAWRSYEAWERSGFPGRVVLRYLGAGGGPCVYDVPRGEVFGELAALAYDGWDVRRIMINEAAPDHAVALQGEFLDLAPDGRSDYFLHSFVRAHMRPALARQRIVSTGLRTRALLRGCMTPSSYADFEAVLERCPGHVVELSVYRRCLGDVPGRNALVWEVRRY